LQGDKLRKIKEGGHSSRRFVSLAVLAIFSVQMLLIMVSYNTSMNENIEKQSLFSTYLTWHVDTDLQFMSNILGVEGNQNIGLSLVTLRDSENKIEELNRFNPDTADLLSTSYLSSSGLFEVATNSVYKKFLKNLLGPEVYLLLLRLAFMSFSYLGFYYLLLVLAKSLPARIFPVFTIFLLINPWFFLDATSLFWSPAIRYAPIFYLCFVYLKKQGDTNLTIYQLLKIVVISIASSFNGFEMTGLTIGLVSIWLFFYSGRKDLKVIFCSIFVFFISIFGGFIAWFVVLVQQFQGNTSAALTSFSYTLLKHSNLNISEGLPTGALQSSDPDINLISALFRITSRTSLVLPYDLMIILRSDSRVSQILVLIFVTFTSISVSLFLVSFILRIPLKITLVFSILLITWVFSIKSYAYHHVHILGSALLMLMYVLIISPRLDHRGDTHNNF
jgi:hypothetical protein